MAVTAMTRPDRRRLNRAIRRIVAMRADGVAPDMDDLLVVKMRLHDMLDSPDFFDPAEQAEFDRLRALV